MKPATLLAELRRRGIELSLRGDDIVYRAPAGAISDDLLQSFRTGKQGLVTELRAEQLAAVNPLDQLAKTLQADSSGQPHAHAYGRFVEPVKAQLLARVGLDIQFVRGAGCYLWDEAGNRYLDFIGQYGGLPFGYNPPEIWQAIDRVRINQLPNVAAQSLLDSAGRLATRLLQLAPEGFEHIVFCNSGAEATEVAIKLCRAAKKRPGILSTRQGFHGLTTGSLSATGSEAFQDGFFVRCDDFQHVPFGSADILEEVLSRSAEKFAAFIVEPIQGEAGINLPPIGYLKQVQEICRRYDVLLIVDEVQTGLGRTGDMFGFDADGIFPDVVTLAKALGGGLMPIGAVLYRPAAYSIHFGLRHSSTFAGNAMAAECGLATIAKLTDEDGAVLQSVRHTGDYLLRGLKQIQSKHRGLVKDVRGRGLMQAIEFDFSSLLDGRGLFPILVDQHLLLHLMISYMLHTHRIRVAPTFMGRDVIRLEPALIAGQQECDQLLSALSATLEIVEDRNAAPLVANMISAGTDDIEQPLPAAQRKRSSQRHTDLPSIQEEPQIDGEFGFLVHLSGLQDLIDFDDSLAVFDMVQIEKLKHELTRSPEPTVVGTNIFRSTSGRIVRGHFVLIPWTPAELLQMPRSRAMDRIAAAADTAGNAGVELIGLGGFTSILTGGGIALASHRLPPLTSGNAYTAATIVESIEKACLHREVNLPDSTLAVVGAAGQIGRAVALIFSERVARVMLVGREGEGKRSEEALRKVAIDIVQHQLDLHPVAEIQGDLSEQIFLRAKSIDGAEDDRVERIALDLIERGSIDCVTGVDEIVNAEIIVAVSSAVEPFIEAKHVRKNAIVCDASRPANVTDEAKRVRDDVLWLEGGLVRIPGANQLGIFAGPRPDAAYACVAESVLWTLDPELGKPSAEKRLDVTTIRKLAAAGKRQGFALAEEIS